MKVAIIRANPRKNGHTQKLTDLFIEGLKQGKAEVTEIDLKSKKINQCHGCYNCWLVTPGKCVHDDDMASIMKVFTASDIVVFSTPLYIYSVSGYLKVFLDRLLPYMKNEHLPVGSENIRNAIRNPKQWPQKMAYILVGAFRGLNTFEGARKTLELFSEGLQLPLSGSLIRPESYLLPFTYLKPKTIKNVNASFKRAGFELATQRKVSSVTMKRASAPLSENIEHFTEDSNIYWQEAQNLGSKAMDPNYVNSIIVRNPKILISEMVRHVDPQATNRLKASIQFDFTDKDVQLAIKINKGKCSLEESKIDNWDLKITTSSEVWAQIFLREINARNALSEKKIIIEGDKSLFARLDKYFSLPCD
ncbi:MAG: NAD(P)H-dependent oxidoreductase [Candidatus Aceula meridiana]|nr:NAD(P)H-dependent oxidoreductase [Candidatus Aceula meridiana]